jgi:hypothetical protein
VAGREIDQSYIQGVFGRFPGLNPYTWVPLVTALAPEKLRESLAQPDMPEAVRGWFEDMIRKYPR